MEGVLKELGEWASANADALPTHLREALRTLPSHVKNTTELSQAGPSSAVDKDVPNPWDGAFTSSDNGSSSVDDVSSVDNLDETTEHIKTQPPQDVHQQSIQQQPLTTTEKVTNSQTFPKLDGGLSMVVKIPQYTPEEYFSKVSNPGRRIFRHTLRTAATEAKALGEKTYKELSISQRSWIHDRVTKVCKSLEGHERKIDDILITVLIQAKQYQKRKSVKRAAKVQEQSTSPSPTKPAKKLKKARKRPKKYQQEKGADSLESGGNKNPKIQIRGRHSRKGKLEGIQEPTCMSEYEKQHRRNKKRNEAILRAVMSEEQNDQDGGPRPGDNVTIDTQAGVHLANAYFVRDVDEMFAEVIFIDFIDRAHVEGVQLPAPVTNPDSSGDEKTEFHQLEKSDKFLWKKERIVYTCTPGDAAAATIRRSSRASHPPSRLQ